jgi:hypothetical protein
MRPISDMYFAAALLAYGTHYEGTDKQDPKRQQFLFDDPVPFVLVVGDDGVSVARLDNVSISKVQLYYTSHTLWFPPAYADSLRSIKSIIHSND